jgi:hypothetical protein
MQSCAKLEEEMRRGHRAPPLLRDEQGADLTPRRVGECAGALGYAQPAVDGDMS